jgi:hypothetical protein
MRLKAVWIALGSVMGGVLLWMLLVAVLCL